MMEHDDRSVVIPCGGSSQLTKINTSMNAPSTNMPEVSWLMRHRRRLAQIGLGHLLYAGWNFFFDQVLYVYVIWRLGLVLGGAIMTGLAGLACLLTLLLYQRMKIDWVGAGSLAALEKVDSPAWGSALSCGPRARAARWFS